MRILTFAAVVAIALGLMSGAASAHTISIGSFNAGAPGSVTLVMGTYDHGPPIFQGSIQLVAGPSAPSAVTPFTSVTLVKPAGLIDGVNNFYADSHGSGEWGTKPADSYTSPTNLVDLGPVVNWQAATFFGLAPGLYTYQLSGMTSQNWTNINDFSNNWRGTLVIPEQSTNTPEPASLLLLGLGVAGFAATRRRRRA